MWTGSRRFLALSRIQAQPIALEATYAVSVGTARNAYAAKSQPECRLVIAVIGPKFASVR